MPTVDVQNSTVDRVQLPVFTDRNLAVDVLRLDKIHPVVSGNKWFKLRYYVAAAKQQQKTALVTFGGAWSNHIVATAAAAQMEGLKCIGIIRGENPEHLSATLQTARDFGMELQFVSRDRYRQQKRNTEPALPDHYIIPEGGYGVLGAEGAATLLSRTNPDAYTHICCAVGTGTMMAGLIRAAPRARVTGISVMKKNASLEAEIKALLPDAHVPFTLLHDYHFGGYARHTPALLRFMNTYYSHTHIPSDIVYTVKLFFAVEDLAARDYFEAGSRVLVIHSGGLQGNGSLEKGTLIF